MSKITLTLTNVTTTGCTLSDGTNNFVFSDIFQNISNQWTFNVLEDSVQ